MIYVNIKILEIINTGTESNL